MKRAVKYCGGCNARYDRAQLVRKLEARLGEALPAARPGEHYDEIYVVCGCPSLCADCSRLWAEAFLYFDSPNTETEGPLILPRLSRWRNTPW